jgi:aspartyl-tRNA(Asn)/glutamyl-tRNA(Gln) amidotransferase subunit A
VNTLELTASALAQKVRTGEVSAAQVTERSLEEIAQQNGLINAFIGMMQEQAVEQAAQIDQRIAAGEDPGALAGVPIALKDNICVKGVPTTCASRMLENFVPPYDATVVQKLRAAGAIIVGKTNLDEFAMGSSCETSAFGPTRNPRDPERVPGGSSGGSAAAVASGMCVGALGTDTGGSIRQPASFCGVVGLKPTYSRVSRYGVVAYASSLDQVGSIARSVEDAALILGVISGHDPHDATSAPGDVPNYLEGLSDGPKGLRIGVPKEYFGNGLNPEVRDCVLGMVDRLASEGAEIVDVSLPHMPYAIGAYYLIATSEASSNFARFDGVKYGYRAKDATDLLDMYRRTRSEGFGDEVKRRILLGTFALSSGYYDAYYGKAQRVRTLVAQDFKKAFESVDAIITPTSPSIAFKIGEKVDDLVAMYLQDVYTVSANLAAIPGITVPGGDTAEGLPIGVQVLGPQFEEPTILRLARAVETLR